MTSAGNGVDDSTIRVCPGKAGLVVVISEDDLRETVSVGRSQPLRASKDGRRTFVASILRGSPKSAAQLRR